MASATTTTTTSSTSPSSTTTMSRPIAIIGGGLAGLALAIGLLKRGIAVHIYESTAQFSEIGAGVTFGINAVGALRLVDERLLEGYKRHATFNEDEEMAGTFSSLRWGVAQGKGGRDSEAEGQGGGRTRKRAGELMFHLEERWKPELAQSMGMKSRSCIHRARLMEELVALVPPGITSFGKAFVRAEEMGDGSVKVYFSDGTSVLASAVIGCDGIKSKVRSFVCPTIQATYAREAAYRAVIPRREAESALGRELALNGQLYCGYGGYVITYPIERGEFINVVLMPHDDDEAVGITSQDEWTVETCADEMRARFHGWYEPLITVAAQHMLPSKWHLFDLQHNSAYYQGKICLLGDSAHATTPHLGAGAGMAMEDAYVLSSLIAKVDGVQDIERAFWAYDYVRRPRTQECIRRSREVCMGYGFMLEGVGDDVQILKGRVEDLFKWLWHEDLVQQVQKALKLLDGEVA